jgi:hypothetical protein
MLAHIENVIITLGTQGTDQPPWLAKLLESIAAPAVTTPQAHTNQPPAIGEVWPGQGGVYAGLMRGEDGGPDYHLIVPTDERAYNASIAWGSQGTDEPSAVSERDGMKNTFALARSEHEHPAAQWATELEIDGYKDFYLPARRELRLCWVNTPELFKEGWYWSSTHYSRNYAWYQTFGGGTQDYDVKAYGGRARAVRRFIAQ